MQQALWRGGRRTAVFGFPSCVPSHALGQDVNSGFPVAGVPLTIRVWTWLRILRSVWICERRTNVLPPLTVAHFSAAYT